MKPAFPITLPQDIDGSIITYMGLTVRDYFAAQAMAMKFGPVGSTATKQEMARACYEMADEMLEARK